MPLLEQYKSMRFIRAFEEAAQRLFLRGQIYGSTHLCIGQEAVSVGMASALGPADVVSVTYRGHGHALALGTDPKALLAELMGRRGGLADGRAGSMNVVDLDNRLLGCFGIVGGSIGAATGAALALRDSGRVSVGIFGDGAVNQGYFHECLNLAALKRLPVVFLCENNQYAEFTSVERGTSGRLLDRPRAMGIPTRQADGNLVSEVAEAMEDAVQTARAGTGPAFVEAVTYRFCDHARGDPIDYRAPGELDQWKKRDPLELAERALLEDGVAPGDLETIRKETESTVASMVDEVREWDFPSPEEFPKPGTEG